MGAILRPFGFKGSSGNYYRNLGEVVHVISIQKSTASTAEFFKFRLNTGLWSKVVGDYLIRNRGQIPKNAGNCHSSHSPKFAHRPVQDLWWTVQGEADLDLVLAQLRQILIHEEVPRLDFITTTDHLVHEWRRDFPDWIEIIAASRENRELRLC
jgi:Domain of unknown function (DUF4304)